MCKQHGIYLPFYPSIRHHIQYDSKLETHVCKNCGRTLNIEDKETGEKMILPEQDLFILEDGTLIREEYVWPNIKEGSVSCND